MDNRKWESGASVNPPAAPAAPSSGHPTDGDPLASVPPTVPGAYWFYQLGEELRAILTAAGITPDKANLTQLLTALRSAGVFTTPAQFDVSTKAATTAFVKSFGLQAADVAQFAVTGTLGTSAVGKILQLVPVTPGQVLTIPLASLGIAGMCLELWNNGSQIITIQRQGADSINTGTSAVTSLAISPGDGLRLFADGVANWFAVGGSLQLKYSGVFGASLAVNGYQKLPSGRIEQQGIFTASATPGAAVAVTFPIAFPNACRNVMVTPLNALTTTSGAWFDSPTVGGFNGRCSVASLVCHYRAVGD